jgi:hypothetical protein
LAGYYRRFVRDYGRIYIPLFGSLKKGKFHWGTDQLIAFETIKKALCFARYLHYPTSTNHLC